MYENRLLCAWVWWRFKHSIAYRIAVLHAQERWTGVSTAHPKKSKEQSDATHCGACLQVTEL